MIKYASLFAVLCFGSLGVALVAPNLSPTHAPPAAPVLFTAAEKSASGDATVRMANAAVGSYGGSANPFLDPTMIFFRGGTLVIFGLLCYEAYLMRRCRRGAKG
jgi:hypothetical protein